MPLVLLFAHQAAAATPAPIGASSGSGVVSATGRGDATPVAENAVAALAAYATAEQPPAPAKTFPPVFAIPMRRRSAVAEPKVVIATSLAHEVTLRARGSGIVRPVTAIAGVGLAIAIGVEWLTDDELLSLVYEAAA